MTKILAVLKSESLRVELDAAVSALREDAELDICDSLDSAIARMRQDAPELLLLELSGSADSIRPWQQAIDVHDIACPIVGILDDDAEAADGFLVEAVRIGVRDFLRRPASAAELSGVIRRVEKSRPQASRRGRLLAVASTKGGVGKSTIAVNTAVRWASAGDARVLLVDASLQLGVAASLLNLQPSMTIADVAAMQDRLDTTMIRDVATVHGSGLYVLPAPPTPADAAEVDESAMSMILGVAKSAFDLVVVDSFPLLDATTLAIFDRSDHVCIVTENVVPTLTGTAAMLKTLDQLDIPRRRRTLVLNRFAKCGGSLSPSEVAEQLGEPVASVIRHDRRVIEAANLGRPVVENRSWFGVGSSMRKLADQLRKSVSDDSAKTTDERSVKDLSVKLSPAPEEVAGG